VRPKLSYVKGFAPWGWIVGTGVYLSDVQADVRRARHLLLSASLVILAVVTALLAVLLRESYRTERARAAADAALRASEARYRLLVESAGASIFLALEGDRLYANSSALQLLGCTAAELATRSLADVVVGAAPAAGAAETAAEAAREEGHLRRPDGTLVPVLLSRAPFRLGDRAGLIVVATDITRRKAAEDARGQSEAALRAELERVAALEQRQRTDLHAFRDAFAAFAAGPAADGAAGPSLEARLHAAATPADVAAVSRALPGLVRALLDSGAGAAAVNRLVTAHTDAVVRRLGALALDRLGPAPVPFVFLIMGSEGRGEQTLCTDQDHALLFADAATPAAAAAAQAYFLELGRLLSDWLHAAGYARCAGGVMAGNPAWCLPLDAWRRRFAEWLESMEAEDLLQVKVAFDFRPAFGTEALATELRAWLQAEAPRQTRFLAQLARNVLLHAPPLGAFGRLLLEPVAENRRALDIKSAMTPVVDFARLYALRHALAETNTVRRLDALLAAGVLEERNHREIVQVYDALMRIRLRHQARQVAGGGAPDNFLEPSELSYLDRRILRESFANIRGFQARLSYDFTGLPRGTA
jgi:PAS domain S-box-containing protein